MFDIRVKGVNIRLCFGFFAVMALLMTEGGNMPVIILTVCMFHECGHLAVMKLMGLKVHSICFYGGGIRITPCKPAEQLGFVGELAVLLGGAAANMLCFILLLPTEYKLIGLVSIGMGIFSLLPLSGLDGGSIVLSLVSHFGSAETELFAQKLMRVTDIIFAVIMIIFLVSKGSVNFTLPLTMAFIVGGSIADSGFLQCMKVDKIIPEMYTCDKI